LKEQFSRSSFVRLTVLSAHFVRSGLYLDFARADALLTTNTDVGGRNPLDVTAAGRACLAVMTAVERRRAFDVLSQRRGNDWPTIMNRIDASILETK
jgi:DNA-binding IclR family transcriptional regulator